MMATDRRLDTVIIFFDLLEDVFGHPDIARISGDADEIRLECFQLSRQVLIDSHIEDLDRLIFDGRSQVFKLQRFLAPSQEQLRVQRRLNEEDLHTMVSVVFRSESIFRHPTRLLRHCAVNVKLC